MRTLKQRALFSMLLLGALAGSVFAQPVRLNPELESTSDVTFAPGLFLGGNGDYVVYEANKDTSKLREIFSVPITGGESVKLSPALGNREQVIVDRMAVTPDGEYVVYLVKRNSPDRIEIFASPIAGGEPIDLTPELGDGGTVGPDNVVITPDSGKVIFRATESRNDMVGIYAADIANGRASRLADGATVGNASAAGISISRDSSFVVFAADAGSVDTLDIYRAPLAGGSVARLNPELPQDSTVLHNSIQITPDGDSVVYIADAETQGQNELYIVPAGGGSPIKLNPALQAKGDVLAASLTISADGKEIYFFADAVEDARYDLYAANLDTADSQVLAEPPTGTVFAIGSLRLSPEGDTMMIRTRELPAPDSQDEEPKLSAAPREHLHLIRRDSGEMLRLNGPLVEGGTVVGGRYTPDGKSIVYVAATQHADRFDLYRANVAKAGTELLFAQPNSGKALSVISADVDLTGQFVVFLAQTVELEEESDEGTPAGSDEKNQQEPQTGSINLYSLPITGGRPHMINAPLADEGRVYTALVSPAGGTVVYTARQDDDEILEVYAAPIAPGR